MDKKSTVRVLESGKESTKKTTDYSAQGRKNRRKGKNFENAVARTIRHIFPNAKRHLEYQKQAAKGFDLDGTGKLLIQCKAGKRYVPVSTINEIQKRDKGDIPLVVTKEDQKSPVVFLYLSDFVRLLEESSFVFEGYEEDRIKQA